MPAAPSRQPGFLQGIILLLPVTMAVVGIMVLAPVVHLMLEQFKDVPNHEYLVMGGILTMPAIWMLLFSPFAGWLADRFGRRNLLLVSMVIYAFVGMAPTMMSNIYLIILTRAGVGICESIVMTVSTTMISDYFHGRARERWLASQTAVASLASIVVVYIGGQLGAAYGWRGPFYLYLYSLPLALAGYKCIWEPTRFESQNAAQAEGDALYVVFPWARIMGICTLTVLASIAFFTVITKNAEALVSLGVSDPALIGKISMLASIGVPLGTFIYWGIARLRIAWVLLLDFAFIGVGFALMGSASDVTTYAMGSFVNQVGCGMVLPTMLVWATRGLAYSIRGRGNGIWQAAFAIGQFLSGMLVTLLSKHLNGLLPTMGLMGKAAISCAVIAGIAGFVWRAPPDSAGSQATSPSVP